MYYGHLFGNNASCRYQSLERIKKMAKGMKPERMKHIDVIDILSETFCIRASGSQFFGKLLNMPDAPMLFKIVC